MSLRVQSKAAQPVRVRNTLMPHATAIALNTTDYCMIIHKERNDNCIFPECRNDTISRLICLENAQICMHIGKRTLIHILIKHKI